MPAGWKAAGILPAAPACQGHRLADGRETTPGDLVSPGEVIQPHRRYMVAPPSVHPSGRPYRIGGGVLPVAGLPASPTSGQTANDRSTTRHHDVPASTDSQTARPPTPQEAGGQHHQPDGGGRATVWQFSDSGQPPKADRWPEGPAGADANPAA